LVEAECQHAGVIGCHAMTCVVVMAFRLDVGMWALVTLLLSAVANTAQPLQQSSGQAGNLRELFEPRANAVALSQRYQRRRGYSDLPPIWWTRVTAYAAAASCSFRIGVHQIGGRSQSSHELRSVRRRPLTTGKTLTDLAA
jgi:hypothetical protein